MPYFKATDKSGAVYDFEPNYVGFVKITKKEFIEAQREQEKNHLLSFLKPGNTVFGNVRSVSRSGMQRSIKFYVVKNGHILNITWSVSRVFGKTLDKKDCLKVNGCGMDMIFHVVHNLGSALWPSGTPKPHSTRNGQPDSSGGYALVAGVL